MLDGTQLRLHGRLVGHADLAEACHLVPDALPLPPAVRAALPALWARWLGHPGFNADLIEDMARPPGDRLVGLGMAMALDERWQARMRQAPPVHAAACLYEELHSGRFAPPSERELAQQSARGEVAFLVLHYHQRSTDLSDPDTLSTLGVAMDLFRRAHAGFRLAALYQEGFPEQAPYLLSMGFSALTRRDDGGPELFGLTREQAERQLPGTPVRDAFQFTSPRLGFSASERKLLRLALTQVGDAQLGDELGLSAHTVKKLWRSILQRAGDALPTLFDGEAGPVPTGTRGPEKRRDLLQYLRQHPEELRPFEQRAVPRAKARLA